MIAIISGASQSPEILPRLEQQLLTQHQAALDAPLAERLEKKMPTFKKTLMAVLKNQETFDYPFEKLGEKVKIVSSDDGQLRTFSWNEFSGGRRQDMSVIAQFRIGEKFVGMRVLDTGNSWMSDGYQDRMIYQIDQGKLGDRKVYLLRGWGSHSNETHFESLSFYEVSAAFRFERLDSLVSGSAQGEMHNQIIVEASRKYPIEWKIDLAQMKIAHPGFLDEQSKHPFKPTGKQVVYQWNGSYFERSTDRIR